MSGTPSHSAAERAELCDALAAAGPDAPTLCGGWTARDLAAHLVTRERRPDAALGIAGGPLHGWSERVRRRYAARPFEDLVRMYRTGPPAGSPFALPGADARLNLVEHVVHCEDVRRAAPRWQPRDLPVERQEALWNVIRRGRLFYRRSPVGVVLQAPGGLRSVVIDTQPAVTLTGAPAEQVLYATGRGAAALVEVTGPEAAVRRFGELKLAV